MTQMREFGKSGPRLTFNANEGNMTMTMGDGIQGMIPVPTFVSPLLQQDGITPGVYVKLTNDMEVALCGPSDPMCIGKTVDHPQWKGQQPIASANYGSFTPRIVTVELFCNKVTMVNLEAANSAITYGNYIKRGATTAQRFDKSATATAMIALQSASANTGAFTLGGQIAVMFGVSTI